MSATRRRPSAKQFGSALALLSIFCSVLACVGAVPKPNIVVILADDQGWGDLSVNGNTNLTTPRIDQLARSGARFDRFFVSPVCSPTRAEFLTGRYHLRGGVHGVSTGAERLNLGERTIAEFFKAAGYRTGAFGKWHNGTQFPYHPNARGFDEFYGFCSGHWGAYFDPPLEQNGRPVQGKGFITDDLTDHAIRFIESNKDRAFFCYVPFNTPHSPMQVPERFYSKFKDRDLGMRARNRNQEDLGHTRAALAMCENIDWNIGRILDRLDALGLRERTIVLYFSDNGPNGWRWNGGMKGRKGSTDEGGVRAPLFINWPGHVAPGRVVPQISAAIDLLPTLAEMTGIPFRPEKPIDGKSLFPLLMNTNQSWPDRLIFSHWGGKVSVRSERYRLDQAGKLFDMEADPGQDNDVSSAFPTVCAELVEARDKWLREMPSVAGEDTRPFTVGYPEFPSTQLPARDGVPHGDIRRSASAPNCSFFEDWKSAADSITWDIAVAHSGIYDVLVYHTCPKEAIGAQVEAEFKGSRTTASIREAHDPPLTGAEHDRVPRKGESYVKEFKPLSLGTIHLPEGRGLLTLRAVSIPAGKVMDVRSVVLNFREQRSAR